MCVAACACACCSIAITRAPSPGSFSPHSLFILSHNIPSTTPTSETRLLSPSLLPLLDSLLLVPRLYVFLFCSLFLLVFLFVFLTWCFLSFFMSSLFFCFLSFLVFHLHHRSRHSWLHCIVDLLFHRPQHLIILLSLLPSSLSSHHHLHCHHHHCRRPFPWP